MDKHSERKLFMENELSSAGLGAIRISGVDGRALSEQETENLSPKKTLKDLNLPPLSKGELGCAVSHRNVYDYIIDNAIPYTVVMEDDISIPSNFKKIIEHLIETHQRKDSWDYISFDYTQPGLTYLSFWLRSIKIRYSYTHGLRSVLLIMVSAVKFCYIFPLATFEGFRNLYKRYNPGPVVVLRPLYLAGCYLITLKTAKILRELNTPIVYQADKVQNQARIKKGLRVRAYAPLIIKQEKQRFGSIITGKSGKDL